MSRTAEKNDVHSPSPQLSLKSLVLAHHAELYRYAYRLCGLHADAEDLTQQAFMIAQQKLDQVRESEKAKAWLFAVLRSCYLKSLRKNTPQPACCLDLNMDSIAETHDGWGGETGRRQTTEIHEELDQDDVQRVIEDLPPDYKLVISMFYFEELSYKQIAEALDIPMGTVMSRLSRAKRRLREVILEELEESGAASGLAGSADTPSP